MRSKRWIVVSIIGGILILYFLIVVILPNFPIDTGTQYLQQCPTKSLPQPGPNTSQLETLAAFTVNPGTVAKFCVEFNSSSSTSVNAALNASVFDQNNMSNVPANVIQVLVQPATLAAPPLPSQSGPAPEAYAVFALNVGSNASGFYVLSISGICPLMLLSVGYDQINYSDFAYGWHHQYQCTQTDYAGSTVSFSNVGAAYSYVPLGSQRNREPTNRERI